MTKTLLSFEASLTTYQSAWRKYPEEANLYQCGCENFKVCFNVFHLPCIIQITNIQKKVNIYDVFYLLYSNQHISAAIATNFRVMFLLQ